MNGAEVVQKSLVDNPLHTLYACACVDWQKKKSMNVLVYHVRTFTVVQGRGVVEADTTHVNKIGPFFFGTMILGCANIVRWTLRARAEQKERRPKKKNKVKAGLSNFG